MIAMFAVKPQQSQSMTTRDGVRLDADIYYPDAPGSFPVLLMRQPYGRAIASTVVYAHPRWYAAHGYIVVIQDVRGRGTSEGEFRLFATEVADGYDTVAWAAQLPGSSGQVGMYGFSYQGMTQLYAAQAQPPALKALAPAMVGYDLYQDWAYENGALRLQAGLGWAIQLAAETARRRGDASTFHALTAATRQPPWDGPCPANPEILQQVAPDSFWHDWLAHPQNDAYWQALKPQLAAVDLPMLHIGGWFDPYLTGDLRLYQEMVHRHSTPQHLWIGPWSHLPWGSKVGAVDFGPAALSPIDRLQIHWFDHCLKGVANEIPTQAPVQLFEMGRNTWQTFSHWPSPELVTYYLRSSGLAGIRTDDGQLLTLAPDQPSSSSVMDWLVHDPWRPVPALGGHASSPAGAFERSHLDQRSDVLTYTTQPLTTDWVILGTSLMTLDCQADAASYDLCAILSVVYSDGRVYNFTQGYGRFANSRAPVTLPLQPTYFRLRTGEALRLSLSAACFPAYAVNPGTGASAQTAQQLEAQIITLAVGGQAYLQLPILAA